MVMTFSSCTLLPVVGASIRQDEGDNNYKTTLFYVGPHGRACVSVPLQLRFPTAKACEETYQQCFAAKDDEGKEEEEEGGDEKTSSTSKMPSSVGIDAKVALTFGTGESATVESVQVNSVRRQQQDDTLLLLDSTITVRILRDGQECNDAVGVKMNLDVSAFCETPADACDSLLSELDNCLAASAALNMPVVQRTDSFTLSAALCPAVHVSVKSVSGPAMGQTFLAVSIQHSCQHDWAVNVQNVALQPSHAVVVNDENAVPVVSCINDCVQWKVLSSDFPTSLSKRDAVTTIVQVDAVGDTDESCMPRTFTCPVSVSTQLVDSSRNEVLYACLTLAPATWETAGMYRANDDLLVKLQVQQDKEPKAGTPFIVTLTVTNTGSKVYENLKVHTSSNDATTTADKSTQELIPLDVCTLLGSVGRQSVVTRDLRFLAVTTGCYPVPDFVLVSDTDRFVCPHKLRASILS